MMTIHARNINDAFMEMIKMATNCPHWWRPVSPRGQSTIELVEPMATTYRLPEERVLFHPTRDANPFFHFFEALWILAGRGDVAFLKQFNSNIASYSDDGKTFHAPYGRRLRAYMANNPENGDGHFDQLLEAIRLLRADNATRQAVLAIWDPELDLGAKSKDIPCNDLIFLKIRDNALEMRVCCRSNDVIWGAYGANVVQFSTLQEFIAGAVGVAVGPYTQISDSFHIYNERDDWKKISQAKPMDDPYVADVSEHIKPYPMFTGNPDYMTWLSALQTLLQFAEPTAASPPKSYFSAVPYFNEVAWPMYRAWRLWKSEFGTRNDRIKRASYILDHECLATDWALAGKLWLERRREAV